jgi:uncharacterized protein with PQ loop repeat
LDTRDALGALNTIFVFVSLLGVLSQLRRIWSRKKDEEYQSKPAQLLSLNQFTMSFFAYLSFFVYGYSIEPFNHYIVWPRLIASALVWLILFEIWHDRRDKLSLISLSSISIFFLCGVVGLVSGNSYSDESKLISQSLILVVTILLAQGYFHQMMLIYKHGDTGAVDLKMSQFILMMDISTIAFALSIGIDEGWPLLFLASVSGVTKLVIMYQFRWVRLSETARQRRQLC